MLKIATTNHNTNQSGDFIDILCYHTREFPTNHLLLFTLNHSYRVFLWLENLYFRKEGYLILKNPVYFHNFHGTITILLKWGYSIDIFLKHVCNTYFTKLKHENCVVVELERLFFIYINQFLNNPCCKCFVTLKYFYLGCNCFLMQYN